jgi:ferritin-like metal-binding protein YciE
MRQNDDLRDKLVTYLEDAYAMEHEIVEVLEKQVKETDKYPDIQARIQQHLEETRLHEQRMADRLKAYNEKPSGTKSITASLIGNLIGAAGAGRTDKLSKTARDDYMTEHMEIAAYELLIATAHLYGDNETIYAAQANLRDEVRIANWLEQHLPDTVVYSFQEDGIPVDVSQIPNVRRAAIESLRQAQSGIGYESLATDTGAGVNPPGPLH